jgi:hypothetical protein
VKGLSARIAALEQTVGEKAGDPSEDGSSQATSFGPNPAGG